MAVLDKGDTRLPDRWVPRLDFSSYKEKQVLRFGLVAAFLPFSMAHAVGGYSFIGAHAALYDADLACLTADVDFSSEPAVGIQAGRRTENLSVQAWLDYSKLNASHCFYQAARVSASGRYHFAEHMWNEFEPYAGAGAGLQVLGNDRDQYVGMNMEIGVLRRMGHRYQIDVGFRTVYMPEESRMDKEVYLAVNMYWGNKSAGALYFEQDPAQSEVFEPPVPPDADQDGVDDDWDLCPSEGNGVAVDEKGCPVKLEEEEVGSLHVRFYPDSATLTRDSIPQIDALARRLATAPQSFLMIEVYANARGDQGQIKALSEKRAEAIKEALFIYFGVPGDRIQTRGYIDNYVFMEEGIREQYRVKAVITE